MMFFFSIISLSVYANNPIDRHYSRVVGHHAAGNKSAFKIKNMYRGKQTYYISPSIESLTITIPASTGPYGGPERNFQINAGRMIRQAFIDWTVSGNFVGHFSAGDREFLENSDSPAAAGITFTIRNANTDRALASTDFSIHHQVVDIYLHTNVIGRTAIDRYRNLVNGNIINPAEMSLENFVTMQVNFAIVHEIGHAFGLDHPNSNDIDDDDSVIENSVNVIILPSGSVYDPPSIMTGGSLVYYRILHESLGRTIRERDVQITPRDFRGARMHWNGTSAMEASHIQRMMEACVATPSCM